MRLDKYLSQATGLSRKDVKRLLHAGEVRVNQQPERNAARQVTENDLIELDEQEIEAPGPIYLMLNKPLGYVCATDDPTHPTVLTLIDLPRAEQLHIAGRLDIDTTGLVLLTDDGKWSHRVTSPRHKTGKVYRVETADPIPASAIEQFQRGIRLESEPFPTKPAELQLLGEREALVVLHEGRYHQVKRMFAALGNRVTALHRERVGSILLDAELEPGEYRELTQQEIDSI